MERVVVDGTELAFEVTGSGDAVLFIHGALIADSFRPLMTAPELCEGYRLILYHRRGYSLSAWPAGPVSIERQAEDCKEILRHLDVVRAHIVGHSFGGAVALQLALDAPQAVQSLALLEPSLMIGVSASDYRESILHGEQRYRQEGAAAVTDEFLEARWPGYRAQLEAILPGAVEQLNIDARATFEVDLPGLLAWRFGDDEARRISKPTLAVVGADSEPLSPRFAEVHRALLTWMPQAEGFVLLRAAHGLQMQNPDGMAATLATFFERHSCSA